MVSVWHGQRNFDLVVDNRKPPVFDYPYYVKFSEILNTNVKLRKTFLTPYHHVIIEKSKISFGADISEVIKELRSYEEILEDDEIPQFKQLINKVKDLPFLFIKKSPAESLRTFLPNLNKNMLFKIQTMKYEDALPLNKFFMSVATNSDSMSHLVIPLFENKILESSGVGFNYCNGCHKVSISNEKVCFFCNSKKIDAFPMYHIPQPIMVEWLSGGNKFLEAMSYNAVKKASPKSLVYSSVDVKHNGSVDNETEADIFIKQGNSGCVILATTNPSQPTEKKQAKLFQSFGFKVVLVTTESSPREMKNHVDMPFVSVREDQNFPGNLIDYLRKQKIIS